MDNSTDNIGAQAQRSQGPLPQQMVDAKRWILWKEIPNADPSKKARKVPCYVDGANREGTLDSPEDIARLGTFEVAVQRFNAGGYAGLGFALGPDGTGNHWQGFDYDNVPPEHVDAAMAELPGYVEASPSGRGCHAIGYGRTFTTLGSNGTNVEAYAGGRFFTVTGDRGRGQPVCIATFVAGPVAAKHGAARAASGAAGTTTLDPATITDLRSALLHLRADDYDIWYRMGMALHELGDVGRGLWMAWSATSEKFDPQEAARKWDRDLAGAHSIGYLSVFHEAQARGWINPRSNAASQPEAAFSLTEFKLLRDNDLLASPAQEWFVKDVIPVHSFGVVFGPSMTFKSFLLMDLLAHIARGETWFGHRVKKAPCVYVPFEGRGGIPKRVAAWRLTQTLKRRGCMQDGKLNVDFSVTPESVTTDIHFVMEPINLRNPIDRKKLVDTLKKAGLAGCVIAIDTLAQAGGSFDENSSKDMGELIGIMQELQRELGGVVIAVHHTGKDTSKGLRGWSGLQGALDFAIECERSEGLNAKFTLDKVKDGENGKAFPFAVQVVDLGNDSDGDPVTSLTVVEVVPPVAASEPAAPKDAQQDADDEAFIHMWVKRKVEVGDFPSSNSVQGQLAEMKAERAMTQTRVRTAIHRLRSQSLLVDGPGKSPSNNTWMRAVEGPAK